jgi:signal transduction histidine kinase
MIGASALHDDVEWGSRGWAEQAALGERQRLARDLHDSVSQTLISLHLSAQTAADMWDTQPAQAREALDLVRHLASAASTELRTLLLDLRDAVLVRQGLSAALAAHCAVVRRASGLQVDLHLAGGARPWVDELPAAYQEALYRLVQEALANVVRHARATRAAITLVQEATVRLVVEDDGVGFGAPAPAFSYGLAGMRERVAALDGRLQLETRPGGGARVVAELPLPAATAGPADAGAWGV